MYGTWVTGDRSAVEALKERRMRSGGAGYVIEASRERLICSRDVGGAIDMF